MTEDDRRARSLGPEAAFVPARALIDRYPAILLDAFGVLVDQAGALPGSREFVRALRERGVSTALVTNDMTRTPREWEELLAREGMAIPAERIVTSGLLLARSIEELGLRGAPTIVLGSEAIEARVRDAGAVPVPPEADRISAVVIGSSRGYPLLDRLEATLSALYRTLDRGDRVHLILPNPDVVYPTERGGVGLASGAWAVLLEEALRRRFPSRPDLAFVRLGKPHRPIFEIALAVVGTGPALMIGDQIETDIAGATAVGIDSALVVTGVSGRAEAGRGPRPTYLLDGLLDR